MERILFELTGSISSMVVYCSRRLPSLSLQGGLGNPLLEVIIASQSSVS